MCLTVQRSPQTRFIISPHPHVLSTQEVAERMLRSTEDVCSDEGELPDGQGPVVRWRVLPLTHSQQ